MSDPRLCEYKLPLPDKETYKGYPVESKLDTVYDLLCISLENQNAMSRSMQKKNVMNLTYAGGVGGLGGAIVALIDFFSRK